MKKLRKYLLVLVATVHLPVFAADLYGKVWLSPGSKPASSAKVEIKCPHDFNADAMVDRYGRYRLTKLPSNKNCMLRITHGNASSGKVTVYSGTGSKNMNIELRQSGQDLKVVVH